MNNAQARAPKSSTMKPRVLKALSPATQTPRPGKKMLGELQMQMWHGGETILSCAEALEKGALLGSWNCLFKVLCAGFMGVSSSLLPLYSNWLGRLWGSEVEAVLHPAWLGLCQCMPCRLHDWATTYENWLKLPGWELFVHLRLGGLRVCNI